MAAEHLSLITTPVLLFKGDEFVSQGTGFFYLLSDKKNGDVVFLITNYHVLTGYPPEEKKTPKGDNIKFTCI